MKITRGTVAALLLTGILLGACGSEAATPTLVALTATAQIAPTATTVALTASAADLSAIDAAGVTVTLTRPAERIVCLTAPCIDILAELGMEPVAYRDQLATDPHFYGERAKGFKAISGSFNEPSFEDIAATRPDLVLGLIGAHDTLRDGLKTIAPLYLMGFSSYNDSIAYLKTVGKLTGKSAEADAAAAKFEQKLAVYRAKSPNNKSALLMWGEDVNFGISSEAELAGSVLKLVTPYPWPITADEKGQFPDGGIYPFSVEKILATNPDAIFSATSDYSSSNPPPLSEQLGANPIWKEVKAVQDGQVFEVNYRYWTDGRGTRSLGLVLDEAMTKLYPDVFPQPLP